MKQIFLDTETTGLEPKDGHRIVEVVAIACSNRRFADEETFHHFCNPERDIEQEAQSVHGLTADFLADKTVFADIANDLQDFLRDGEIIIHNAEFDCAFLDSEFERCGLPPVKSIAKKITCSLKLSRQKNITLRRHRLEDLCRHFGVDDSARTSHSALLDAKLLAQVYYAMMREQMPMAMKESITKMMVQPAAKVQLLAATAEELTAHEAYIESMEKDAKVEALWRAH
ncbi:MAG: DNA polymerase III subunit epsilon [Gammaproteobacteria bacterium WSBS_2016_MAG_OTU1]